jgi:hypothetical protein
MKSNLTLDRPAEGDSPDSPRADKQAVGCTLAVTGWWGAAAVKIVAVDTAGGMLSPGGHLLGRSSPAKEAVGGSLRVGSSA